MDQQTVLITGGTGYFGHLMTRHILDTYPTATVRILSRGELLQKQMALTFEHDPRLRFFIGDVRDASRLDLALRGVTVLIHAAALKHIDTCEYNAIECTMTNVYGTTHVLQAAIRAGVATAVLLSTDKAVAPTTVYGTSKMLAEKLWIQGNGYSPHTRFSVVRYGNVVTSRGSFLEVWAHLRAQGKSLPVTSVAATRFWMTGPQAVALVDCAITGGLCGGILVPSIPAFTLGHVLDALTTCYDTPITFHEIGLRPAEKLHETLMLPDEMRRADFYALPAPDLPVFYCIPSACPSWATPLWTCDPLGLIVPTDRVVPLMSEYTSHLTPWRLPPPALVQRLQDLAWFRPDVSRVVCLGA